MYPGEATGAAIGGNLGDACSAKQAEHSKWMKNRERIQKMTIGERIDEKINALTGHVEKLQVMKKRLGTAADLKADDFLQTFHRLPDEDTINF
jgi:transcriptional regulator of met regulon